MNTAEVDFTAAPPPEKKVRVRAWAKTKSEHQTENDVESYLMEQWEALGGTTRKWSSPAYRAVPDRILFHPALKGRPLFVECKAPGKTLTEAQYEEHQKLLAVGALCSMVDSKQAVDRFIADIRRLSRI